MLVTYSMEQKGSVYRSRELIYLDKINYGFVEQGSFLITLYNIIRFLCKSSINVPFLHITFYYSYSVHSFRVVIVTYDLLHIPQVLTVSLNEIRILT